MFKIAHTHSTLPPSPPPLSSPSSSPPELRHHQMRLLCTAKCLGRASAGSATTLRHRKLRILTGRRLDCGGGGGGEGDVRCLILWNWSYGDFFDGIVCVLGDVVFATRAFARGPEAPLLHRTHSRMTWLHNYREGEPT